MRKAAPFLMFVAFAISLAILAYFIPTQGNILSSFVRQTNALIVDGGGCSPVYPYANVNCNYSCVMSEGWGCNPSGGDQWWDNCNNGWQYCYNGYEQTRYCSTNDPNGWCAAGQANSQCYNWSNQFYVYRAGTVYDSTGCGIAEGSSYSFACNRGIAPQWNGTCVAPTIGGISVYDNSSSLGLGQYWTRTETSTFTASITVNSNYAPTVHWTLQETDSTGASASTTSTANPWTVPHLIAWKAGVTYTYNLSVYASNQWGNSSTQTFTFYTYYPANFNCNTPGNGRVIATDLHLNRVVEFNSDNNNGCQSTFGLQTTFTPINNSGSASQNNAANTYNGEAKDSLIFYPGYTNVLITSDFMSGDVWAMTWTYDKNSNITYKIDPNSVKVIQIANGGATGGWGGITDMEFDTMAGNGNPSYFWVASQQGVLYRIPFAQVNAIIQPWLSNNTYNGPLWLPNYAWSSQTFINGVKVVGTRVYYNDQNTATGEREMRMYDANSGAYLGAIGTGYYGASLYYNGSTQLQGGNHLDGLTQSPDGHYLFATLGGGGRFLYVVDATTYSMVGLVPINPPSMPAPGAGGGIDGIEVDGNWQLYMADEFNGIYSVDANAVVKSARDYGNNLYNPEFVNAQQYIAGNGGNWDDVVPLSGPGAAATPYTPYFVTTNGNTFSDGGYSISNLNGLPFSTYGVLSGSNSNTFTKSNNSTGSLYSWEFQGYQSGLNHVSGTYSLTWGYDNLYSKLCQSGANTCNNINFGGATINNAANGMTGGIYVYNNNGGTLTINADNGGIYGNGILFVSGGGTINVIGDHNNDSPAANNSLLIVTKAAINFYPSSYYTNVNNGNAAAPGVCPSSMGNPGSTMLCQWVHAGFITDGNITVVNYGSVPNYIQPMVVAGVLLSYGQVTNNLGLTYFNQWWPSLLVQYDPGIINNLSQYFSGITSTQQLGL